MQNDSKAISDYRELLTKTEQDSQATFDKTVITLSGGALGLSFAFTKDVVGTQNVVHTGFLCAAWIGWSLSATAVLTSFLTSQMALRKAIYQLDSEQLGTDAKKMRRPGGWYDRCTGILNISGLALFFMGLGAMMIFLKCNIKDHMNEPAKAPAQVLNEGHLIPAIPADTMVAIQAGNLVPPIPATLLRGKEPQPQSTEQVNMKAQIPTESSAPIAKSQTNETPTK